MVSINYASKEVSCKIVYYGPGLSGKTTNLQYVHQKVPNNTRGKLISLATESDRTLYFDFLPINIGSINGFAAKFQLYTVPGQVYYNATRRLVLRGVDGVVFVADSQSDKMDDNLESLSNLKENLEEYGYDIHDLPIVIQYNKTDLPGALSLEKMDAQLNEYKWPSFVSSAVTGVGVFDTLKSVMKLVLERARTGGSRAKLKPSNVEANKSERAPEKTANAFGTSEVGQSPAQSTAAPVQETRKTPVIAGSLQGLPLMPKPKPRGSAIFGMGEIKRPASGSHRPLGKGLGSGGILRNEGGSSLPSDKSESSQLFGVSQKSAPPSFVSQSGAMSTELDNTQDIAPQIQGPATSEEPSNALDNTEGIPVQTPATSPRSIVYDPLEGTPIRRKKRGFFRRLFGGK
ncbi:MAG: GTPase domain-containing protein [candidate division Zixibacteria bacterium]|nr:GTPase domain-containing protein [candidate division Zixibacteria bacterium]